MEKIKLVIWDLDETFWKGTLSEGGVKIIEENVEIVKELSKRGIISSISSKNDYDAAKKVLVEAGIWDFFIFPSINWKPKGESVKWIINKCQLRAPNVLFIDDNVSNRKEVEHYNPGINTMDEDCVSSLLSMIELKGKNDSELSRLKQYKILEDKSKARESYSDNHAFLKESDIIITFISVGEQQKERVLELINRTNQLNFTKIRLTEQELNDLLNNTNIDNVCIHVKDRFGDYGICGFYSLEKKENHLKHFLFSCRILNLGIEAYVYERLGMPHIDIVDPVAGSLYMDNPIDWISEDSFHYSAIEKTVTNKRLKVLMLGGCDLEQLCHYLNPQKFEVLTEFNYPNKAGIPVHREHTVYFRELETLNDSEKAEIFGLPFCDNKMFDTLLYDQSYDVLVYSLLMNYTHCIYKNKQDGYYISYGGYMTPEALFSHLGLTESEKNQFLERFEYLGLQPIDSFISDLEWLLTRINKQIIFINGAETEDVNSKEPNAASRHKEMNAALNDFVKSHPNRCSILDVRKFAYKPEHHRDTIRHYQRNVYVEMAMDLIKILDPSQDIDEKYIKQVELEQSRSSFFPKIKSIIKRILIKFSK